MTPILKHITDTIAPAITAAMPQGCDGPTWRVKNEGACIYTQRTDEKRQYLYGPVWPVNAERNFVTLDDTYDVQFAFVVTDTGAADFAVLGGARNKTNTANIQLVVATFHRIPNALDHIEYALNQTYGVTVQSINYDTLRNVQRFLQPNADSFGIDPERLVAVVNFQYIFNFSHNLSEL